MPKSNVVEGILDPITAFLTGKTAKAPIADLETDSAGKIARLNAARAALGDAALRAKSGEPDALVAFTKAKGAYRQAEEEAELAQAALDAAKEIGAKRELDAAEQEWQRRWGVTEGHLKKRIEAAKVIDRAAADLALGVKALIEATGNANFASPRRLTEGTLAHRGELMTSIRLTLLKHGIPTDIVDARWPFGPPAEIKPLAERVADGNAVAMRIKDLPRKQKAPADA